MRITRQTCAITHVNISMVFTTDDIVFIVLISMIQLCYNTAGGTFPVTLIGRLKTSKVPAIFDRTARCCPLTNNSSGIVSTIAIYRTEIDTVFDCPLISGRSILITDDTTRKTVCLSLFIIFTINVFCRYLTSHKSSIDQTGQIIF